jgi:ATP-dependent Clp protease ATP-binding subunit ClpB
VWDLFLQVFDDGRLTDRRGQTVDFRHTIIILTSNLGAAVQTTAGIGFGATAGGFDAARVAQSLGEVFRPEFINRLDEIIFFHSLGLEHLKRIVDIQIHGLLKRLEERKIQVELTESARGFLVTEGFDPTFGARPLKRTIQRRVLDPLAMRVLEGEFREGDRVEVDLGENGLTFLRKQSVAA